MEEFMTVVRAVSKFGKKAAPGLMIASSLFLVFHGPRLYDGVQVRARYVEAEGVCRAAAVKTRNNAGLLYLVLGLIQMGTSTAIFLSDRDEDERSVQDGPMGRPFPANVNQTLSGDIPGEEWGNPIYAAIPPDDTLANYLKVLDELVNTDKHLGVATKTGAGKTTFLKEILHRIWNKFKGNVDFYILDPKNSDWMGLEKVGRVAVPLMDFTPGVDQIDKVFNLLCHEKHGRIVRKAKNEHPIYLICDEWFAFLSQLQTDDKKTYEMVKSKINRIAAMGREFKVHLILVGQSHLCDEVGLSSKMRDNFGWIALGREGEFKDVGYLPIEKLIEDRYMIAGSERDKLAEEFPRARQIAQANGDLPLILTTCGQPRFGIVPNLAGVDRQFPDSWLNTLCKQSVSTNQTVLEKSADLLQGDSHPTNVNQTLSDDDDGLPENWADRVREVLEDGLKGETGFTRAKRETPPTDKPRNLDASGIDDSVSPSDKIREGFSEVAKSGFPASSLGETDLRNLVEEMIQSEMTQTQIIRFVWGFSPGKSKFYTTARDEFKHLTNNNSEQDD